MTNRHWKERLTRVRAGLGVVLVTCLAVLTGCRQEMADQPRYEVYESSRLFPDGMASRHPVEGTVARAQALDDAHRFGILGEESVEEEPPDTGAVDVDGYPFPITDAVLRRGQNRFDIYCSPCHGRDGHGTGIIVQRGLRSPPSFHSDRLRSAPPRYVVDVITDGYGAMFSYASRVTPADRWAIAAYVAALQLSQHAGANAVPGDARTNLQTP